MMSRIFTDVEFGMRVQAEAETDITRETAIHSACAASPEPSAPDGMIGAKAD
jgi:hypothetical protein